MNIPPLGQFTLDKKFGWYVSQPTIIPVLGNQSCQVIVEGYDEDSNQEDYHIAIRNFLSIDQSGLKACSEHVFGYYRDCSDNWEFGDPEYVAINSPAEVWAHVGLGNEPVVSRRPRGDKQIYISVECHCDWEIEHGLQLVFKEGLRVNKVGPYDGHLTLSDAYGDSNLEDVIYR